ncbi:hypothetical protein H9P43_005891 [Blastocladiella emersonii ATCC 22665]|nr:hypothetical protein H9P43_005891 [Blastocladiella emersonii ATCC 22665]
MPPAVKAKKGASKKGGKKAKAAEEAARQAALAEARLTALKTLRTTYIAQAKLFLREPIPVVVSRLDRAVIDNADVPAIALSKAHLAPSDLWALSTGFAGYAALTQLSFLMVPMDDKMVAVLSQWIRAHPTMAVLSIIDSKLGPSCTAILAECLPHSGITSLTLDYNPIGSGWPALLMALVPPADTGAMGSIAQLRGGTVCEPCKHQREAAAAAAAAQLAAAEPGIASAAPVSPRAPLTTKAGATPESLAETARLNAPHSRLQRLSAKFTDLGADAGEPLAAMIRSIQSLKELDISGNHLGARGFSLLCGALRANSTLESLNVAANAIRVPAAPTAAASNPIGVAFNVGRAAAALQGKGGSVPPTPTGGASATIGFPASLPPLSVSIPEESADGGSNSDIPPPSTTTAPPTGLSSLSALRRLTLNGTPTTAVPPTPSPAGPSSAASILTMDRDAAARDLAWVAHAAAHLSAVLSATEGTALQLLDLRHNTLGDDTATAVLEALKSRKTWLTSGVAAGSGGAAPPVVVHLSERTRPAIFAKLVEVNRWMDALIKKRRAAAAKRKGKGGAKKKKV